MADKRAELQPGRLTRTLPLGQYRCGIGVAGAVPPEDNAALGPGAETGSRRRRRWGICRHLLGVRRYLREQPGRPGSHDPCRALPEQIATRDRLIFRFSVNPILTARTHSFLRLIWALAMDIPDRAGLVW